MHTHTCSGECGGGCGVRSCVVCFFTVCYFSHRSSLITHHIARHVSVSAPPPRVRTRTRTRYFTHQNPDRDRREKRAKAHGDVRRRAVAEPARAWARRDAEQNVWACVQPPPAAAPMAVRAAGCECALPPPCTGHPPLRGHREREHTRRVDRVHRVCICRASRACAAGHTRLETAPRLSQHDRPRPGGKEPRDRRRNRRAAGW